MNDGCAEPGCYEDQVTYSHDMNQIESILSWSTEEGFFIALYHYIQSLVYISINFKTIQSVNNPFCSTVQPIQ